LNKPLNLIISSKDALIVTDVQIDFLPGGALSVQEGDIIIPALNEYMLIFKNGGAPIVASRDWHPPNHISFKAQGGPWSPHCVQETGGAAFSSYLKLPEGTMIVSKATNPAKEAYSVFAGTGLADKLKKKGVNRVFIGGLATDYCIVTSVLDAVKLGFEVVVLMDAIKGINVNPGDVDKAIVDIVTSGAIQVTLEDFPESFLGGERQMEEVTDKPLTTFEAKKKARMRPKGSYKQVRRERG